MIFSRESSARGYAQKMSKEEMKFFLAWSSCVDCITKFSLLRIEYLHIGHLFLLSRCWWISIKKWKLLHGFGNIPIEIIKRLLKFLWIFLSLFYSLRSDWLVKMGVGSLHIVKHAPLRNGKQWNDLFFFFSGNCWG